MADITMKSEDYLFNFIKNLTTLESHVLFESKAVVVCSDSLFVMVTMVLLRCFSKRMLLSCSRWPGSCYYSRFVYVSRFSLSNSTFYVSVVVITQGSRCPGSCYSNSSTYSYSQQMMIIFYFYHIVAILFPFQILQHLQE